MRFWEMLRKDRKPVVSVETSAAPVKGDPDDANLPTGWKRCVDVPKGYVFGGGDLFVSSRPRVDASLEDPPAKGWRAFPIGYHPMPYVFNRRNQAMALALEMSPYVFRSEESIAEDLEMYAAHYFLSRVPPGGTR